MAPPSTRAGYRSPLCRRLKTAWNHRRDRAVGIRTALGIACGTCVWGLAGFFGIHALFAAAPWLYLALKLGGGAYLLYLGARLFVGSFHGRIARTTHLRPLSAGSAFRLYGTLACALTTRPAATAFTRLRHCIDRLAGLAFMGFGATLALER